MALNINGASPTDISNAVAAAPQPIQSLSNSTYPGAVPAVNLSGSGQSLLNTELAGAQADTNDTPALMQGVGANGSSGILKDTSANPSDPDLATAFKNRSQQALDTGTNQIREVTQLNAPVRLAQRQATADGGLAEAEQLRFNSWSLNNTQILQAAQLQAAQNAATASFLGSILGLAGAVGGAAIGSMVPGVGTAAGALVGSHL